MKNIYILGTPRSGKSTLASAIKKRVPEYTLVSMEALRNGFIKVLPDLNMNDRNSEARQNILPDFIVEFINWNKNINKNNYASIVEGSLIDAQAAERLLTKDDIVIFLGHNNLSMETIIQNIIENDTETDYTYNWSSHQIESHFKSINNDEELNKTVCNKNDFIYIDSSVERETVFNNLIDELIKRI